MRPFPHFQTLCFFLPRNSICFQAAGFADYVAYLGQVVFFLRRREWDCRVQTRDANDGAVEVVEGFFVDDGGDLSGEAPGAGVFVEDDDFVGLLHGLGDGFAIEWRDSAQVEDFEIDPFLLYNLGSLQSGVNHGCVSNDAEVAAFADDVGFADGDDVVIRRDFAFDAAVEIFVLEEEAGIVVADGGFDQTFGVVGRGGTDYFESGIVDEPHFRILRVEGAAVDVSAARSAQDQRGGCSPEVMGFCDHVADLVKGTADEVHELEFRHGAHAGEGGSEGRAYDGGFGDGGVDDALGAEAVDETVGDFEGAAVNADVFAEAEDRRVAVHFFPDSLADGFEVG